jgi:hypothetical protein
MHLPSGSAQVGRAKLQALFVGSKGRRNALRVDGVPGEPKSPGASSSGKTLVMGCRGAPRITVTGNYGDSAFNVARERFTAMFLLSVLDCRRNSTKKRTQPCVTKAVSQPSFGASW